MTTANLGLKVKVKGENAFSETPNEGSVLLLSLLLLTLWRGLSVRVCASVTLVYPAKTAEPIEMPFACRLRWAYMGMPSVDTFSKTMRPFVEIFQPLVVLCWVPSVL